MITIYCEYISNGKIAIQIYCESVLYLINATYIEWKTVINADIYFLLFTFIRLKNARWNVLMIPSNSPFRRVCQIRYIHVPTSCNSRIYGSRFVIQVLQVLYTRMSYFMWLEFPFFLSRQRHNSARLFRTAFSPSNSFVLPISLHVYNCTLCVLPSIFESRDSTPLPSINKPPLRIHTYTHSRSPNCTW